MMFIMAWLFWLFSDEAKDAADHDVANEENIDSSVVHFDEGEINNDLYFDESAMKHLVQEDEIFIENFEECHIDKPLDFHVLFEKSASEETIVPVTVLLEESDNYVFDSTDETDLHHDEFDFSSAVTCDNEEVLKASLLKNRPISLIEHRGEVSFTPSPVSSRSSARTGREDCTGDQKEFEIHKTPGSFRTMNFNQQIDDANEGFKIEKDETAFPDDQRNDIGCMNPKTITINNVVPGSDAERTIKNGVEITSNLKESGVKFKPGKLTAHSAHRKSEEKSKVPSAKLTDFEKVMKSRNLHTETMDAAANILGDLGHRKEKIAGSNRKVSKNIRGSNRKVSKHWGKLQDAVSKRQFLAFKDAQLQESSD